MQGTCLPPQLRVRLVVSVPQSYSYSGPASSLVREERGERREKRAERRKKKKLRAVSALPPGRGLAHLQDIRPYPLRVRLAKHPPKTPLAFGEQREPNVSMTTGEHVDGIRT